MIAGGPPYSWGLSAGECLMRGPGWYAVKLGWNYRPALGSHVPAGEFMFADVLEIYWRWPRFDGMRVWRFKMTARELEETCA